jgi:hypothetical protein
MRMRFRRLPKAAYGLQGGLPICARIREKRYSLRTPPGHRSARLGCPRLRAYWECLPPRVFAIERGKRAGQERCGPSYRRVSARRIGGSHDHTNDHPTASTGTRMLRIDSFASTTHRRHSTQTAHQAPRSTAAATVHAQLRKGGVTTSADMVAPRCHQLRRLVSLRRPAAGQ